MNPRTLIAVSWLPMILVVLVATNPLGTLFVAQAQAQDDGMPPTDAMAWVLGTKLGIAAVGREAGADEQTVGNMLNSAQVIADALGTAHGLVSMAPRLVGASAKP